MNDTERALCDEIDRHKETQRQLAEAQDSLAVARSTIIGTKDALLAIRDERDALQVKLAEAQANMAAQARREIAEIASGHWPNVEQPIFDPITVLHAFRGKLWTERDALKAKLEQAREAKRLNMILLEDMLLALAALDAGQGAL